MRLFEPRLDRMESITPALAFADATPARLLQRVLIAVALFEDAAGLALDPVQRFRDQIDRDGVGDERDSTARGAADSGNQPAVVCGKGSKPSASGSLARCW
jgi:hypothetical protein